MIVNFLLFALAKYSNEGIFYVRLQLRDICTDCIYKQRPSTQVYWIGAGRDAPTFHS